MALGKFNRPTTKAAAAAGKKQSRWKGVSAAAPRDPMPTVGLYRFRVVSNEHGVNPGKGRETFKIGLEVVASEGDEALPVGSNCVVIEFITGNAAPAGLARVKAHVMAAAGFDSEEEYDAFDPDGEFIDSLIGEVNKFSEEGLTTIGRLVDCQVTRGGTRDDGDYYRVYSWGVVPDAEQKAAT